uniref:Uncharacterized protein n=1 Tax=Rhizophagus irregularis (strain DAOM 181602 / DAOM 197198 / MUCL 43194) TaxID=747089 RepID=U9UYI7_RHIID
MPNRSGQLKNKIKEEAVTNSRSQMLYPIKRVMNYMSQNFDHKTMVQIGWKM